MTDSLAILPPRTGKQLKGAWDCFLFAGVWPLIDTPEVDPSTADRSHSKAFVAVANHAGILRLYNYPATDRMVS